jgi:selenocysteine-specific elongation factor
MSNIVVGAAGHIDHGKTALVKAITGIDGDRLKEEKERGITIDLGFANLAFDNGDVVSFIDVPGHERFIKNMLAGIGGIDAVMLVISANEGIKPQTREHFDICSLLHIRHGFTVLTKVDKTPENAVDQTEREVREFLKGSFLEHAPVLRVSSTSCEGIPNVVGALRALTGIVPFRETRKTFRLPIDRCFTIKGFGTVVTGTVMAGRIQKDDEVEILPSMRRSRVRGVQVHGKPEAEAIAGQRAALNLPGIERSELGRGMVLSAPGAVKPTSMMDCEVSLLASAPSSIRLRKRIRFHLGSAELMGYVVLLACDRLNPGQSGRAQIRLESPTVAATGDRFIIRQYSPMLTIGGGEVLDPQARKHRRLDSTVLARLDRIEASTSAERDRMFAEEAAAVAFESVVDQVSAKLPDTALYNAVADRFRDLGLTIPTPDEVMLQFSMDRKAGRNLVRQLIRENVLVKVSDDLVLHHQCIERLIENVRILKPSNATLDVSDFKNLTGVSRKYAIPLLEYLDRQRVTRKNGKERRMV